MEKIKSDYFDEILELFNSAKTWRDYHLCELRLMELKDCPEANELMRLCRKRKLELDTEKKESLYLELKDKISSSKKLDEYESIMKMHPYLKGYKDSDDLIELIRKKADRKRLLSFKSGNIVSVAWNSNIVMISLSAILVLSTFFIFSGLIRLFSVISEVIFIGFAMAFFHNEEKNLGKAIFIATIIGLVFGLILGLIFGIDLYPSYSNCKSCGGKGYFGGGKYGQMVDCPDC